MHYGAIHPHSILPAVDCSYFATAPHFLARLYEECLIALPESLESFLSSPLGPSSVRSVRSVRGGVRSATAAHYEDDMYGSNPSGGRPRR